VTVAGFTRNVSMGVPVQVDVALPCGIDGSYAQHDQHCGHAKLKSATKGIGNVDFQEKDEAAGQCE
jgi:hypothetical protein